MNKKHNEKGDISKLLEIMARLRDRDSGCPWDLAQDFSTIAPYTIEEAYEVADAIERGAFDELAGELGDLLFQVVFHAQMAAEEHVFAFDDVVETICDKMIRRHPHVFADAVAASSDAVTESWEAIKRQERPAGQSLLEDIAIGLPALTRALKLGRRAATVGFDWPALAPVRAKVEEELGELDRAIDGGDPAEIEAEIGDLLFTVANLARHCNVDPEKALRGTNARFRDRFGQVEDAVRASGRGWETFDAEQLESLWQQAKRSEGGA
jgi:ATP diphosphatase